jgi:hypothetical protein
LKIAIEFLDLPIKNGDVSLFFVCLPMVLMCLTGPSTRNDMEVSQNGDPKWPQNHPRLITIIGKPMVSGLDTHILGNLWKPPY